MSAATGREVAATVAAVLVRELVAARKRGMRVLAVTSPLSLVAGLAARRLGAPDLAIAGGFTVLDAVDPVPTLTRGEAAYGLDDACRGPASDTFVAVARGFVGVCTTPAQLDARGAANLSRIGGSDDAPAVALPGSRGLPDNNDMPGPVWYVLPRHTPRQLVATVDFASGPPPSPGRHRRLLTPLGVFALDPGGWRAVSLHAGVTAAQVREATGFAIACDDAPVTPSPSDDERAALAAVDPHGLHALDLLDRDEAQALVAAATAAESGSGA